MWQKALKGDEGTLDDDGKVSKGDRETLQGNEKALKGNGKALNDVLLQKIL